MSNISLVWTIQFTNQIKQKKTFNIIFTKLLSYALLLLKRNKIITFFSFFFGIRFTQFVTRRINYEIFFSMITDDSKIEVTLTTTVLSPELNSTSVVPEDTLTTTGISSELSSEHFYEISSSTPFLKSFTSVDKAMESNNGMIVIYGFFLN